jgi:serine/threonine protein kinase
MTECITSIELDRFVAGKLEAAERSRWEDHLRNCDRCRRRLDERRFASESTIGPERAQQVADSAFVVAGADDRGADEPTGAGRVAAIPGYEILRKIHEGGQGVVYLARQTNTKRMVALKILSERDDMLGSRQLRFDREVRLIAGLNHPAIVTVYESGVVDHCHYFSMEYVEGKSLAEHLQGTRLGVREILSLFQSISAAVGFAHQSGIVHRDLKPNNIQIDKNGDPHILDFGLAKAIGAELCDERHVTVSGEFLGTLAYAAPEQTTGELANVGVRADVYSIGMMLYEALTGEKPYNLSGDLYGILRGILHTDVKPPSARRPELESDIDAIVLKALAKEPERRYATATELADDLERFLGGHPIRARRDSLTYVMRTRVRYVGRKHLGATCLTLVMLASVVGYTLFDSGWVIRHSDRLFESAAQSSIHRGSDKVWHEDVVVVALDDATIGELETLATEESLAGLSADSVVSWRMLHGAILKRLARGGPRAVAFDIIFRNPQPQYDPMLIEGMAALQAQGCRVILGTDARNGVGRPELSPPVAAQADGFGWIQSIGASGMVRGTVAAVTHPRLPTTPSLSVQALAAWRHPECRSDFEWHRGLRQLTIRYVTPLGASLEEEPMSPAPDRVTIEYTADRWNQDPLRRSDISEFIAGATLLIVPSAEVLAMHTVSYLDVLAANDAQLQAYFQGKLVLIGDIRLETVVKPVRPDRGMVDDGRGGREEFLCYVHAAAISDMLSGIDLTRLPDYLYIFSLLFVSVTGLFLGLVFTGKRRFLHFVIAGAIVNVLIVAACLAIATRSQILVAPTSLLCAFWISGAGATLLTNTSLSGRSGIVSSTLIN